MHGIVTEITHTITRRGIPATQFTLHTADTSYTVFSYFSLAEEARRLQIGCTVLVTGSLRTERYAAKGIEKSRIIILADSITIKEDTAR